MRVTLSPAERAIVETTVALANRAPTLLSHLFELKRFTEPRLKPHVEVESFVSLGVEDVEALAVGGKVADNLFERTVAHYHAQLRKWLSEIARRGMGAYSTVAPELQSNLPQGTALRPTLRDGRIIYRLTVNVVPGLFAYGTALILDRDRGLAQRLGQCGYCERFNLTFEGRPRTYCNEAHRLAYDRKMAAERMREWRKRNKKERRQKR